MNRLLRLATSIRTTVVLLLVLSLLLLLNVAVPQERTIGTDAIREMVDASTANAFLLDTLGLANIPTSPVFLFVLVLFFINLVAVLVERLKPTLEKTRLRTPSLETAIKWTSSPKAMRVALPDGWDARRAIQTLRGFGYKPVRISQDTWWGVKHRMAPLGFLIFHISFFFLSAGGLMIYYTRFVAGVRLIEGQPFDGYFRETIRTPPVGVPTPVGFTLVKIDPHFTDGEPTMLEATIRSAGISGGREQIVRINEPAKWGSRSILVTAAGIAPEIWLEDLDGFTIDRVSVATPTRVDRPTTVPLAEGKLSIQVRPHLDGQEFPSREILPSTRFEVTLPPGPESGDPRREVLETGQIIEHGPHRMRIANVRYWGEFLVVDEKGGLLLILGFVLGVIGAVWRLMLHRREIVVRWTSDELRVTGRGEFFLQRFQDELATIMSVIDTSRPTEQDTGAEGRT